MISAPWSYAVATEKGRSLGNCSLGLWAGGREAAGADCLSVLFPAAAEPERPQAQAGMEHAFHMDSAYSEQAALLLQRGRQPPGGTCAWSKGSLPVRMLPRGLGQAPLTVPLYSLGKAQ